MHFVFKGENMKIVFVSNFLNHHQIPFCKYLKSLVDEFWFIATDNGNSQGYQTSHHDNYLIDYFTEKTRAEKEILSADAVIFGACPDKLVTLRMKEDKLSFIYSERIFKKGILRCLIPKNFIYLKNRYLRYKTKNLYVLAASAFLPYDLSIFGFPQNKIFKWGYFPSCSAHKTQEKEQNTILYVGRLLKLKHADTVIKTAQFLKQEGVGFKVNIVGDGPEKDNLLKAVHAYKLQDHVHFLGSKTHTEVLKIMNKSQIYMFTSDFNEGWGAVLNEAMASGCAIVASSAIGSVPFLINHGENGLIYKYGNYKNAYNEVKSLLCDTQKAKFLGENAKATIAYYNHEIAAERFVNAVKEFHSVNTITSSDSGIFSSVKIIKNNWFK